MTGSPMTQWPNTNMVRKALEKIPFVITVDEYLTSTALYSDLVLPCAGIFEMDGVLAQNRSPLRLRRCLRCAHGDAHRQRH